MKKKRLLAVEEEEKEQLCVDEGEKERRESQVTSLLQVVSRPLFFPSPISSPPHSWCGAAAAAAQSISSFFSPSPPLRPASRLTGR